jgi:hypothetical protein
VHLETVLPQLTTLKHLDTWSQMLSPLSVVHMPPALEALTYRIFPAQLLDLSKVLACPTVLPALKALEFKGAVAPGKLAPMQFMRTMTQSIQTGQSYPNSSRQFSFPDRLVLTMFCSVQAAQDPAEDVRRGQNENGTAFQAVGI